MEYLLIGLGAYILGSSSMAFYLSLLTKKDVRKNGTGNLGASNTMMLLGWKAAVAVGVHDIGKGILAVLLAKWIFPELSYAGAVAGAACVLGHIFPFYLKFKGGKGLASFIGILAALDIRVGIGVSVLLILVTLITDYIAIGTMATVITGPLVLLFLQGWAVALILFVATAVVICKHHENFRRLMNGTEVGLRGASKGKYRMK
jgi:glycerol-3-phosphate acyltransferase PlsY